MMWVCYCDPPHFCGRPSPRGLTRFCSSFPPVVEWYSGWGMRQKAALVRDSTQEFLLVRMTQDPDICLQKEKKRKKHSQEETRGRKKKKKICSEVDWTCEQMLDSCCEKLTQAALCILDGYTTFTPESCRPGSTSAGLLRITSSPKSAPGDITHHLSVNVSREWGLTDTLTHDCYYRLLTILSYCI